MARLILITVLLFAVAAIAQTPFTLEGLGQNVDIGTARDVGRGGWGLADRDTLVPSILNPAALADLHHNLIVFSGEGSRTSSNGGGELRRTWRASLPNVRLAVPLLDRRLAFAVGFKTLWSSYYQSHREITRTVFEDLGTPSDIDGREYYNRNGSIVEIPLGLSWRLHRDLSLAASVNLVRGSVEDLIVQIWEGPLDNEFRQVIEAKGHSVTVSALWDVFPRVRFGTSVTAGYDMAFDRTISLSGVNGHVEDDFSVRFPPQYKAGIQVELGSYWRVGADGVYAALGETGDQVIWSPSLRDEWTVAAGVERRLHRTGHGGGYVVPIRFGAAWHRWGHQVGGQPIDERRVSVGTGVPFKSWLGVIDVSLTHAWIGSESENGVSSRMWRLGLSISGLERLVF